MSDVQPISFYKLFWKKYFWRKIWIWIFFFRLFEGLLLCRDHLDTIWWAGKIRQVNPVSTITYFLHDCFCLKSANFSHFLGRNGLFGSWRPIVCFIVLLIPNEVVSNPWIINVVWLYFFHFFLVSFTADYLKLLTSEATPSANQFFKSS